LDSGDEVGKVAVYQVQMRLIAGWSSSLVVWYSGFDRWKSPQPGFSGSGTHSRLQLDLSFGPSSATCNAQHTTRWNRRQSLNANPDLGAQLCPATRPCREPHNGIFKRETPTRINPPPRGRSLVGWLPSETPHSMTTVCAQWQKPFDTVLAAPIVSGCPGRGQAALPG